MKELDQQLLSQRAQCPAPNPNREVKLLVSGIDLKTTAGILGKVPGSKMAALRVIAEDSAPNKKLVIADREPEMVQRVIDYLRYDRL